MPMMPRLMASIGRRRLACSTRATRPTSTFIRALLKRAAATAALGILCALSARSIY